MPSQSPAATEGPRLPAQSRISSRTAGDDFVVTIPPSARAGGCFPLGFTAGCAFLAITFTAQGLLARKIAWSFLGLLFFLLTAAQMIFTFGRRFKSSAELTLRITPDCLILQSQVRRQWPRSIITAVKAQSSSLVVFTTGMSSGQEILCNLPEEEVAWIVRQIERKYQLAAL